MIITWNVLIAAYFYSMSAREHSNAVALALYLKRRGTTFELQDIVQPNVNGISPKISLQYALNLEIENWKSLSDVYMIAKRYDDIVTMETLASNYFNRQANIVEAIDYLYSMYMIDGVNTDSITQLTDRILFTELYKSNKPFLLTDLSKKYKL